MMLENFRKKLGTICLKSGVKLNKVLTGVDYFQEVSKVIDSFQIRLDDLNRNYLEELDFNRQQFSKRLSELTSELKQYRQIKIYNLDVDSCWSCFPLEVVESGNDRIEPLDFEEQLKN